MGLGEMYVEALQGREARCYCGRTRPSTDALEGEHGKLAFFEYRGPESERAQKTCRHCRYHDVAHKPGSSKHVCDNFEAMVEGYEYDTYYCGCRGWD